MRRRAGVAIVVSSLGFPPLRAGQTVGYGFQVLRPAGRHPVGAFVRVPRS